MIKTACSTCRFHGKNYFPKAKPGDNTCWCPRHGHIDIRDGQSPCTHYEIRGPAK